jgi:uncharacterized membrane protein YgcG
MKPFLKFTLSLCLLLCFSINSQAQQKSTNIPTGKIVDNENLFTKAEIKALESHISEFIKNTKIPMSIVVASMPNNASDTSEWSIGTIESPKGIIVVISKSSKVISFGIGKELSKTLTKEKVDEILNTQVLPEFSKKQYKIGISNSINEFLKLLVH